MKYTTNRLLYSLCFFLLAAKTTLASGQTLPDPCKFLTKAAAEQIFGESVDPLSADAKQEVSFNAGKSETSAQCTRFKTINDKSNVGTGLLVLNFTTSPRTFEDNIKIFFGDSANFEKFTVDPSFSGNVFQVIAKNKSSREKFIMLVGFKGGSVVSILLSARPGQMIDGFPFRARGIMKDALGAL